MEGDRCIRTGDVPIANRGTTGCITMDIDFARQARAGRHLERTFAATLGLALIVVDAGRIVTDLLPVSPGTGPARVRTKSLLSHQRCLQHQIGKG
jgi:hypothetical protein